MITTFLIKKLLKNYYILSYEIQILVYKFYDL